MANKKSYMNEVAGPSRDWQCEEDVRSLTRAAEVLADKTRASMAMSKFKKTQRGIDHLLYALTSTRKSARRGY